MALAVAGAGAAHAAVATGSVTVTVTDSYIAQLASKGVAIVPQNYSSISYDNVAKTVSVTFAATGGDASLVNDNGTVQLSGGIVLRHNCKKVALGSLAFDLGNSQFDGQPSAAVGEVPLVDLAGDEEGNISTVTSGTTTTTTDTYTASSLVLDSAGAAYLDSALNTKAFTAGQAVGSLSATWTVQ
jgi:hypothetical protein